MAQVGQVPRLPRRKVASNAPAGTGFVRTQIVFRQPANASGAVLFDDLRLRSGGVGEVTTPVIASLNGGYLNLAFASLLGLSYQIRAKTNLTDAAWLPLTNLTGNGTFQIVPANLQASTRFYRVVRFCD